MTNEKICQQLNGYVYHRFLATVLGKEMSGFTADATDLFAGQGTH